jgi:hypothetical protein
MKAKRRAVLVAVMVAVGGLAAHTAESRGNQAPTGLRADGRRDPRATIFVRRGCTECHAIAALGVAARADVGPDLTFAYADVLIRYDVNLESFFYNPTGVMRLMLASHLRISAADRDSMVHILRGLYLERRADMDEVVPSFPPMTRRAGHP